MILWLYFDIIKVDKIKDGKLQTRKRDLKMSRYFLITGLDDGRGITPYIAETNGLEPYIMVNPPHGDHSRQAQEISKSETLELMKQGIEIW